MCPYAVSYSVVSYSLQPYGLYLARLLSLWNFPGKNTCHFHSRRSSWFRDRICISWGSCFGKWTLYHWCCLRSPMLSAINFKIFYTYLCMHAHTHTHTHTHTHIHRANMVSWTTVASLRCMGVDCIILSISLYFGSLS